jgi:branched-chain amino acid aminotransferase
VILEGVTRGSVLELARQRLVEGSKYLTSDIKDLEVVERNFTMLEVEEAWKEGRIVEAFLSGTAVSFPRALLLWNVQY